MHTTGGRQLSDSKVKHFLQDMKVLYLVRQWMPTIIEEFNAMVKQLFKTNWFLMVV